MVYENVMATSTSGTKMLVCTTVQNVDLHDSPFIIAGKSKKGELSIFPKRFIVLSPCLHMMPRQKVAPGAGNALVKVIESLTSLLCCHSVFTHILVSVSL